MLVITNSDKALDRDEIRYYIAPTRPDVSVELRNSLLEYKRLRYELRLYYIDNS